MTAPNVTMSAEQVLAVIAKHRDSHMSCALADAYSAQESPRLRDAHAAVAAMAEREAALVARLELLEDACKRLKSELRTVNESEAAMVKEVEALRADAERLNWLETDMAKGDEGVGIYSANGFFVFPYLVSNAGGSGGGVGEAGFDTLRQAIDSARAEARDG